MKQLFVGEARRGQVAGVRCELRCPAAGSLVAVVAEGNREDVLTAAAAARRAFRQGVWPATPARERGTLSGRVAKLVERAREDLARTDYGPARAVSTQDAGKAKRPRPATSRIHGYHPYVPQAGRGDCPQSGIGREPGPAGLDEYRETRHGWPSINPRPQDWFRK